jgi:nicotinate-nucleotide pyrophosphorylase (carboxylating)
MARKAERPVLPGIISAEAVRAALIEDLGRAGDITSIATIPESARARAVIAARQPGTLAGLPLAHQSFAELDPTIKFSAAKRDGDKLRPGTVVAQIEGPARSILSAERVALNFLCHLSGIASETARLVELVSHTHARICCTRKTTPGLRALEKYAVRCGGGSNHRFGLDDAILIKDNHIAVAGGVMAAIRAARAAAGHLVKIEVEIEDLADLAPVLEAGVDAVLLDNMDAGTLRRALALVDGRCVTEASGGIDLDTAAAIAATGVDLLSVGALTHSARWLDVSLEIRTA